MYFIAISRRKLDMPVERAIMAINSFDLQQVPLESVEILQRMVPTDQEVSLIELIYNALSLFLFICVYKLRMSFSISESLTFSSLLKTPFFEIVLNIG